MNLGITNAIANIGVSFETIILLIFLSASLIFFARNFIIGIMMLFLGSGLIFMWFYVVELNYTPMLIICFMSLIVLTLSLYAVGRVSLEGGVA